MEQIILNLYKTYDYLNKPISITRGETTVLSIQLEGSLIPTAYDLTDLEVRVAIRDKNYKVTEIESSYINVVDPLNGLIEVTLVPEIVGQTLIQIQVSDGEARLTFQGFIYFVNRNPNEYLN